MKLHLGSGKVKLKGWQNIDLEEPEADMHLDLREKLPFGDNLISHIYNEHFIEHITREEGVNLLKECYRVLKDDGVLRLSTPDLKYVAVAYLSRNVTEWQDVSWQPESPCFLMNDAMRLWGHQFVYDAEELEKVLMEAGFNSIQFVNYSESSDKELANLETRPFHNELIVEARKTNSGIILSNRKNDGNEVWVDEVNASALEQIERYQQSTLEQTNSIRDLEEKLAASQQQIKENEQIIADKEQIIADKEQIIADKEQIIADKVQIIADIEQRVANHIEILTTHIGKLEAEIILRGQRIIDMETDLLSHTEQFAIRDQHTADLINHIHNIEEELTVRAQHIMDLNNYSTNLSQRVTNLEWELVMRNQHISELNNHIQNLEVELVKLRTSLRRKLISATRRLIK